MAPSHERAQPPQQRLPVPSLFVGPPSLPSTTVNHPPPSTAEHRSARDLGTTPRLARQDARPDSIKSSGAPLDASDIKSNGVEMSNQQRWRGGTEQADDKRADAMWAEMQNTLEEVELSAASRANVFSVDHARALEELRKAQIGLAQAWARSEADDEAHDNGNVAAHGKTSDGGEKSGHAPIERGKNVDSEKTQNAKPQNARFRSGSTRSKGHLEKETDDDIALARQRRLANDQYFERVNKGVVDVVARLEVVARKMRDVETESQEIWGSEQDSLSSSSIH